MPCFYYRVSKNVLMHMGKHYKPMQTVICSALSATTVDGIDLEAISSVLAFLVLVLGYWHASEG